MQGYKIWLVRIEISLAVVAGFLGVLTIFWRDWIEVLTGWSPDHHNGSLEYGFIAALLVMSAACALAARRTYRQLAAVSG